MDDIVFKDVKATPDRVFYYTDTLRFNGTPIIIDNGSYQCRVGWATCETPLLVFKNILAKPRKEKGKKDGEIQVGNDIANIEAVRFLLKSHFDRNLVVNSEVEENILNHAFSKLGIYTETVDHPIVMSEAFANPNYCRALMNELLFECYGVSSVCWAVDCLAVWKRWGSSDGLIVGLGHHSTVAVPVVAGRPCHLLARRLDIGGHHISHYLCRLLQLKYPAHFNAITLSRAEELVHEYCFIPEDYKGEISKWADCDYYNKNVLCIQLASSSHSSVSPEQQKDKKRELTRRFIEMNARKREEKLAEDEEQLSQLLAIQDLQEEGDEEEFQSALKEFGLANSENLQKIISQIQARVEKTRQQIVAANTTEENINEEPRQKSIRFNTPKEEEEFKNWITEVKKKRDDILEKQALRRQKRLELAKRRTPAAIERMRLISKLARENVDDDFGLRDDDWDVYKAISKDGGESESEGESERLLSELEGTLRAAGVREEEPRRLHWATERVRCVEALLEPSLVGCGEQGLGEMVAGVISQYPEPQASLLASNVMLCGGPAGIPGLSARLQAELTAARPWKSQVGVQVCPVGGTLSGWLALRDLSGSLAYVSRSEYLEKGAEYLAEHSASNVYVPTPSHPPDKPDDPDDV